MTQPAAHSGRVVRLASAALGAVLSVALLASACGDPLVPLAESSGPNALVTATPTPAPATPTPTITPTPSPTPQSGATAVPTALPVLQPGLSSDSIRIAVIADVDTGGTVDGLFRDAWTGTAAWAEAVNAAGGLGDRKVKIVTLDTSLFNHRNVLDVVCKGDYFAIVGGQSLRDFDGAELLGTEECNLADFPSDVHGARRAESPNTFLPNPIFNNFRQAGPARWLAEEYPDSIDSVTVFPFDELQLGNETERLREMLVGEGLTINSLPTDLEEGPSERVLVRYEEFETQAMVWNADPQRLIELLREFGANDIEPTWVLCELACYSEQFLRDGGSAVEGVYTWIPHSPFLSPSAAGELIDYQFWLRQFAPDIGWSEVGLQAWMAGRLFEESFNRVLQVEPEAPTREQLISAARSIVSFDAGGILPLTNPAERVPTPCFALMVVENGRWEQAYPLPPRDLDCSGDNLYGLIATRNLEVAEAPVETSSTNSDDADADTAEPEDLENPEEVPEG